MDSVGTETAKLANNLASGGGHGSEEEDAGHDSDNPDDENTQGKKKKSHRSGVTLAKDAAQLQNKKPDLEFSVDPLFKKTCADFDEGGAHGLLMNHLSLGVGSEGALTVVFDAGESQAKGDEDDEQEAPEDVDLSYLRSKLSGSFFISRSYCLQVNSSSIWVFSNPKRSQMLWMTFPLLRVLPQAKLHFSTTLREMMTTTMRKTTLGHLPTWTLVATMVHRTFSPVMMPSRMILVEGCPWAETMTTNLMKVPLSLREVVVLVTHRLILGICPRSGN